MTAETMTPAIASFGISQLAAALAKAQGAFPPIAKNRIGKITPRDQNKMSFSYRYADLEAIIAGTRPSLAKEKIAVIQQIAGDKLHTIMIHESGERVESDIHVGTLREYGDPKQYGICVAYARRYAYQSIVCVSSDDDTDVDPNDGTQTAKPTVQMPKETAKTEKQESAEPADTAVTPSAGPVLTDSQVRLCTAKASAAGVSLDAIAQHFGVAALESINASDANAVLAFISSGGAQ